jgi:hypothetical protein
MNVCPASYVQVISEQLLTPEWILESPHQENALPTGVRPCLLQVENESRGNAALPRLLFLCYNGLVLRLNMAFAIIASKVIA